MFYTHQEQEKKCKKKIRFSDTLISSHFVSRISSFQADLFNPWGNGGGGGEGLGAALAPLAPPCLRSSV